MANINLATIDFCPGGGGSATLQEKSVTITSNGTTVVNPDSGYDGMSKTTVTTNVQPSLQTKTSEMLLSETTKTITPDSGYDGLSSVTVTHAPVENQTTTTITTNGQHVINPSSGYDATTQVLATINVQPSLQTKTTEMLLSETTKTITPDAAYYGLSEVTVTHAPVENQTTTTITTNGQHVINPSSGYDATTQVLATINVQPSLQTKTATPTNVSQSITPDAAYYGLSEVTVNGYDVDTLYSAITSL